MPRGGKREGAGRKRITPETPELSKKFATIVESRIGELGLTYKAGGRERKVENVVDFHLMLLAEGDIHMRAARIDKLDDRIYGRPAQTVINADTRENVTETTFGNLPMPTSLKSPETGKPN